MTALLRQPHRVPKLFCEHATLDDWSGRRRPSRASEERFQAWSGLFDRELAFEAATAPRRSQALVAVSVLLLLYAAPFLHIADAMLDAAVPR